jgi:hypothetical protein
MLLGALSAASADDGVPFPNDFQDWFFVNSLTDTADSPLFVHVAGVHHIYANVRGLPTLKAGGPFPYPDGTIFAVGKRLGRDVYGKERDELPIASAPARFAVRI